MKIRERIGQLNRLQKTTMFKVVATAVVLLAGLGLAATYVVRQAADASAGAGGAAMVDTAPSPVQPGAGNAPTPNSGKPAPELTPEEREAIEITNQIERSRQVTEQLIRDTLSRRTDATAVSVGIAIAAALCIAVIWIGHGLTGLLFALLMGVICYPLYLLGLGLQQSPDRAKLGGRIIGLATFLGAVGVLGFAFVVLMEMLRFAFSGPWAVTAIARNVVNEAVRMKVSLIFIVMLILALAAIPGLLDDSTPLRYRMQAFFQYGIGGTFWIIAILVLFLSVGSVAFEQRDKIIWQTMTKPVKPGVYILGKWLGVCGIAAVLLMVSASGIFLFAEYLRNQRALGEIAPYVSDSGPISSDRFVLENQVMVSRRSVTPTLPVLDPEVEKREMLERIERVRQVETGWTETDENVAQIHKAYIEERRTAYLTVEGGNSEMYVFKGLTPAKQANRPVTLRYRVDIGANDPRDVHRVSFEMPNSFPYVREVPGGQSMTLDVSPVSIDDNGDLPVVITNGDLLKRVANPDPRYWANAESMSFPPDGIEVFYPVGSYRVNFLRVVLVLWIKLCFLAIVSIWAATFLSFSVASLVAFGVFLIAESAGFLTNSLEYFSSTDAKGNIEVWKVIVRAIAVPVATTFKVYADLKPSANLVEGRLLGWDMLVKSILVLGSLSAVLYFLAVGIFRKRELATYSGQ